MTLIGKLSMESRALLIGLVTTMDLSCSAVRTGHITSSCQIYALMGIVAATATVTNPNTHRVFSWQHFMLSVQ